MSDRSELARVTEPAEAARLVLAPLRLDRWSEPEVSDRSGRALELGVGGFVIFGGEVEVAGRLIERLRSSAGRPLWLAADLERGAGQQFRGASELPPPAALASHPNPEAAVAFAGRLTGLEAAAIGINWVLAPVLDLDVEPDNPIVGTRSFGPDPETVARLGRAWIEACQSAGVAACAKHYPGHGRTRTDSHIGLPRVDAPAEALEDDLLPFAQVADRVASVMVAHVAFPALGSEGPATVSPEVVQAGLRGRLAFEGLIATDAMIMGGVGGEDAPAAVRALLAGCDLILYPSDVGATVEALRRAGSEDPDTARRVAESVGRSGHALAAVAAAGDAAGRATRETRSDPERLALDTVWDGADGTIDGFDRARPTEVVVLSDDADAPAARTSPAFGEPFVERLRRAGWGVWPRGAGRAAPAPPTPTQRIVLLAATPRGWKGRSGLSAEVEETVRRELAGGDPALLVLFGHPRVLARLGAPGLCAWSSEALMERAAAAWLDTALGGSG